MAIPFSLFLALKYLRPKRTFIGIVTVISVVGVTLGVAVLVIVLSVMSGFDEMWSEKILSFNAHVTVESPGAVLRDPAPLIEQVKRVEGVTGVSPYVQGLVFMTHQDRVYTPVIRGIDPVRERDVSRIPEHMVAGSFTIDDDSVVIGRDLALQMGLRVGDRVLVYSPRNFTEPDEMHLPEELTVRGIFELGMWEFDVGYALTSLQRARDLYRVDEGVHALQVMTQDPMRAGETADRIRSALQGEAEATTWMEQNRQLFDALRVEKNMMFFLLIFITIVASFSITNTLITVAVQKTREIGLLKALGFANRRITGVFLWQGLIQGLLGAVIGLGVGLLVIAYRNEIMDGLSQRMGIQILPKALYHLSELPARIIPSDLALVTLSVVVICTLSGVAPALRAARLDPVRALRNE